jgi:hypothetical protein
MNNSDMPAMAVNIKVSGMARRQAEGLGMNVEDKQYIGLTKREHFAGLAMQGLVTLKGADCGDTDITAVQCLRMADSLLAELDKSK